jgi:hypothetical protein
MIVNFRAYKINRGVRKLIRIPTLIKKKDKSSFFLIKMI